MGGMTSSAVHRTCDPPVPVEVDDVGGTWPGLVLGWRGERVYVHYSEGPGLNHRTWVAAARVRRATASTGGT